VKARAWLLLAVVGVAALIAATGIPSLRLPWGSSRDAILESGRRINGDIMVVHLQPVIPKLDEARERALQTSGVVEANVVAIWPVEIYSSNHFTPAVLQLVPLSGSRTARPKLVGPTPRPRVDSQLPEVALGRILLERLRASPGDVVTVKTDAAATGAAGARRCKVVASIDLGVDYFDERLIVADITQAPVFALEPTGLSVEVSEPRERAAVAKQLTRRLGGEWRALGLEELLEPLLQRAR
jgi:ABC-type lipoprotein release transport system permease subunit